MSRVSAPWSARAKPQAWRSMWGWAEKGRAAALAVFLQGGLTVERCKALRCSLTKKLLPGGFIRARCFSHAAIALSSSPRSGCVVERPRFKRVICSTRLSLSTWSSFNRQASETRRPWWNINLKSGGVLAGVLAARRVSNFAPPYWLELRVAKLIPMPKRAKPLSFNELLLSITRGF